MLKNYFQINWKVLLLFFSLFFCGSILAVKAAGPAGSANLQLTQDAATLKEGVSINYTDLGSTEPSHTVTSPTINWIKNGSSLTILNYSFSAQNPFNGVSGLPAGTVVRDFSGLDHHGIEVSNNVNFLPVWNAAGKLGGGLELLGNDGHLNAGNGASLDVNGPFSIEFWLQRQGGLGDDWGAVISKPYYADKWEAPFSQYRILQRSNSKELRFQVAVDGVAYRADSNNSFVNNEWQHVVGVYDGSAVKLYINGQEEDSTNASGTVGDDPVLSASTDLYIGTNHGALPVQESFEGILDELKLYDFALSPEQISEFFQAGDNGRLSNIMFSETGLNETWQAYVVPAANEQDGTPFLTNEVTANANTLPVINNLKLATENGLNLQNDTMVLNFNLTDAEENNGQVPVDNINWFKNGSSLTRANLGFNISDVNNLYSDISGLGNHGTLKLGNNGLPKYVLNGGAKGSAVEFSGNDEYISLGNDPSLNVEKQITLELWVKRDGSMGDAWGAMLSKPYHPANWQAPFSHYRLARRSTTNRVHFQLALLDSSGNAVSNALDSNTSIANDTWTHLAATYDGQEMKLYINGQLDAQKAATGRMQDLPITPKAGASDSTTVFLGRNHGNSSSIQSFEGMLDEVRIYDKALSLEQIVQNYDNGQASYDKIVKQETGVEETWQARITAADGFAYSGEQQSNSLASLPNFAPTTNSAQIDTENQGDLNVERIILQTNSSDSNDDPVNLTVNWLKDNQRLTVGNYPMDIGTKSRTNDYSGFGNDAFFDDGYPSLPNQLKVTQALPTIESGGVLGNRLSFPGNAYGTLGNDPSLDFTDKFSIEFWMKPEGWGDDWAALVSKPYYLSKWEDPYVQYKVSRHRDTNDLSFSVAVAGQYEALRSNKSISMTDWTHVVATYDGNDMKLYLNGNLDIERPLTGSIEESSANSVASRVYIGRNYNLFDTVESYKGLLDELKLYGVVLPPEQVQQNYENGLNNTNIIHPAITGAEQTWQAEVTPNDGIVDGSKVLTNILDNFTAPAAAISGPGANINASLNAFVLLETANKKDTVFENVITRVSNNTGTGRVISWSKNNSPLAKLLYSFHQSNLNLAPDEIIDYSGANHHGQLGGGESNKNPTWSPAGIKDGAYNFDGVDDYILVPHDNSLNFPNNKMSFEVWMKGDPTQNDSYYLVMDKSHGFVDFNGWVLQGNSTTGEVTFNIGNGSTWSPGAKSTGSVLDDTWHHVVGTFDGAQLKLYVDGILNSKQNFVSNIGGNSRPVQIGRSWGGGNPQRHFKGRLDEIRLYDYALPLEQIELSYSAGSYADDELSAVQTRDQDSFVANVTPYTVLNDGPTIPSANLTLNNNVAPVVTGSIGTEFGGNFVSEDILWTETVIDGNGDGVSSIVNWLKNGNSIYELLLPFDRQIDALSIGNLDDYSGNNLLVQLNGGNSSAHIPVWSSNGISAGAYEFNGLTDYITVEHTNALNFSNNKISVEFWMKANKTQQDPYYLVMDKSHGFTDTTGWVMQGNSNTGLLGWGFGTGSTWVPGANSKVSLLDDTWHHVVGTYDGASTKLYVDGVLQNEIPFVGNIGANNRPVQIGRSWGGGNPQRHFGGMLDEVKVYNIVLTPEQVLANMGTWGNQARISSTMTSAGETWQALTIPTDGIANGSLFTSNIIDDNDFGTLTGGTGNVFGYAWSENLGWISHNGADTGASGAYGVNIDSNGLLTGYAWSENYGWIDYNPAGPYPTSPSHSAQITPCTTQFSGWIKILSLGDEGWVSLGDNGNGSVPYGVGLNPSNLNLTGYGWSEKLGWIDYNPQNGGVNTSANFTCGSGKYNVTGWAWSDVAGWISHNTNNLTRSFLDFGVNLEDDSNFTGYAWSDHFGWIDYDAAGPYPSQGPDHSARYEGSTGNVIGWAKAISLGDEGWIALNSPGGTAFGVNIDPLTGNLSGYAWNQILGWIQFDPPTGVNVNNPNVIVAGPKLPELLKPIGGKDTWLDYPEYRSTPLAPTLTWSPFQNTGAGLSSVQASYEIDIAEDSSFNSVIYNQLINSTASSHAIALPTPLVYNQQYFWRVRVTDDRNQTSPFAVLGPNGEANSFVTPLHQVPDASFNLNPTEINAKVEISFFDTSVSYGGSNLVHWSWDFGEGVIIEGTDINTHKDPVYTFKEEGPKIITLTVRDSDGYEGTTTLNVNVALPLPEFRRTIPQ